MTSEVAFRFLSTMPRCSPERCGAWLPVRLQYSADYVVIIANSSQTKASLQAQFSARWRLHETTTKVTEFSGPDHSTQS